MTTFRWLHLTDLHWGKSKQKKSWANIEESFFKDIDRVLNKMKGQQWDAVFFTGDLVGGGLPEEYREVDGKLLRLRDHLAKNGAVPPLMCVPGNHDLVRPDLKDLSTKNHVNCMLIDEGGDAIKEIMDGNVASSPFKDIIKSSFENYERWHEKAAHGFAYPAIRQPGLLPGDFSATIKKDGRRIGVLGLNTAFMQLREGDFKGKLCCDAAQLVAACSEEYTDWVNSHHTCLLMTHHPKNWLTREAREHFEDIAPPGRFALHLCGHQHTNELISLSNGGAMEMLNTVQSNSLFGMEKRWVWKDDKKVEEVVRAHGYVAGSIEFTGDTGKMRFWPRKGKKVNSGRFKFDKDTNQEFDETLDNEGTSPIHVSLKPGNNAEKYTDKSEESNEIGDLSCAPYEKEISKRIRKILGKKSVLPFLEALKDELGIHAPENLSVDELSIKLVGEGLLAVISAVCRAWDDFSQDENVSYATLKSVWEGFSDVIGWLLLLSVKDDWLQRKMPSPPMEGGPCRFSIHAETELGIEVIFSRTVEEKVKVKTENRKDVISSRSYKHKLGAIESGLDIGHYVNELKRNLWLTLDPQMDPERLPRIFLKKEDNMLNSELKTAASLGKTVYLLEKVSVHSNHEMMQQVVREAMEDLSELHVIKLTVEEGESAFLYSEYDLNSRLLAFLKLQPIEDGVYA